MYKFVFFSDVYEVLLVMVDSSAEPFKQGISEPLATAATALIGTRSCQNKVINGLLSTLN